MGSKLALLPQVPADAAAQSASDAQARAGFSLQIPQWQVAGTSNDVQSTAAVSDVAPVVSERFSTRPAPDLFFPLSGKQSRLFPLRRGGGNDVLFPSTSHAGPSFGPSTQVPSRTPSAATTSSEQ